MLFALFNAMVAKYVSQIELKKPESLDEQKHVEVMFHLFSIHWIIATALNFMMASDPYLVREITLHGRDFGIGALLGV